MRCFTLLTILLLSQSMAYSRDILIPLDHATIQEGIDAAGAGDRLLVSPGTYVEHLDFKGKAITLKSVAGPKVTVIDGNKTGRVVTFQSGESPLTVLEGFTITNGEVQTSNGGGIDCTLQSSPTITDCIISYNKADALGGGMACRGLSSPEIRRCAFIGNICRGYYEGSNGGGLCCFILSNAIVTDCVFIGNETQYGGGIDIQGSSPIITNCLFLGNVADKGGGAIDCASGDPIITNCTMVQNQAFFGGALSTTGLVLPSYPVLTNCILWENSPNEIQVQIGQATVTYCDVQGGWPGAGNIDALPLFMDLESPSLDSDLHLTYDSPCRDAGSNHAQGLPGEDFEGDPRIAYGTADMGADEFHPHLYYKGEATPSGLVKIRFAGIPGTQINAIIIGANIFDPPLPCDYGLWYMNHPMQVIGAFGIIPALGVFTHTGAIPPLPTGPYTVYLQAAIDSWLTNLCTVHVE